MTALRSRIAAALERLSPFCALWRRERGTSASLRAELAQCRRDLADARSAAAGWEADHDLACDQRRRALEAASGVIGRWSDADDEAHEAYLRSLGDRPA